MDYHDNDDDQQKQPPKPAREYITHFKTLPMFLFASLVHQYLCLFMIWSRMDKGDSRMAILKKWRQVFTIRQRIILKIRDIQGVC
jgi:hypothetical protein